MYMTFKDLAKKLEKASAEEAKRTKPPELPKDIPFWIWDMEQHRKEFTRTEAACCFNHFVGLPRKSGKPRPLYDYQKYVYDALLIPDSHNPTRDPAKHKHLWVKKATGLGITELMLRIMAWQCVRDSRLEDSQMCIVTGPRIETAFYLINRMKGLFRSSIDFDTKQAVIELNGVRIEAFPSHHLDTMRGLANVSFILLDEADFFPKSQQVDARHVSERYIGKSSPYIAIVSTPNAPGGLFDTIEREHEDKCLYKRLLLDYTFGLGKIYSGYEIEMAKCSPSFEREYNLKYLGTLGNVFHTKDIESAIADYDTEEEYINYFSPKSMGIDCGFGSSPFGIVVTRLVDGKIQVIFADEFEKPDYNAMLCKVLDLRWKYNIPKIFVDGANPEFIRSLKGQICERRDPTLYLQRAKKTGQPVENYMDIIPVHFASEHKAMITRCKMALEQGLVQIHPKFDKLTVALRTAIEEDGILDKNLTSYHDIFDAFRLALKYNIFTNL
jgi:aromatic ring-cleaving dioxygenase